MPRPPHSQRARALVRLAGFLLVILTASAWWKVRHVSAELHERSLQVGRQLESWKDPRAGTTTLELNGQRLSITSVSSEASVETVLDRFSALCAKSSAGLHDELAALQAGGARLPEPLRAGRFGVFRSQGSSDEGSAACFAREGDGGVNGLLERISQLVDSGDFAALGQLRYVFARRRAGAQTTHVLTVSSLGSLPLVAMFPERGDAPGKDMFGVRPDKSRRVLSAALEGSKQAGVFYVCQGSARDALRSLDPGLRALGFVADNLKIVADLLPLPARVYVKADEIVLAMAQDQPDGQSHVSTFRLANGGFVRMQP